MYKRILAAMLSAALVFHAVPLQILADGGDVQSAADEVVPEESVSEQEALAQDTGEAAEELQYDSAVVEGTITELPEIETSALSLSFLSDGPSLASGNHVEWIDRIADLPDYARNLYDLMAENADGDGENDALIDPTQGSAVSYSDGSTAYVLDGNGLSGTIEFDYVAGADDTATKANAQAAAQAAVQAYIEEQGYGNAGQYVLAISGAFDRDHPEIFWLGGSISYSGDGFGYSYGYHTGASEGTALTASASFSQSIHFVLQTSDGFDCRVEDYQNAELIMADIANRDSYVSEILSSVGTGSRYEQVRNLNNWLTTNNCYNTTEPLDSAPKTAWECISALEGRTATNGPVCEAYSRAFKVVCDELGIPCVLVDGYAASSSGGTGEAHMWNYVQMEDGNWYAVDSTWNDPTVSGVTGAVSGYENEDWLLLGSETLVNTSWSFIQSHPASNTPYSASLSFTNGPVLSEADYVYVEESIAAVTELFWNDLIIENTDGTRTEYTPDSAVITVNAGDKVYFPIYYNDGIYTGAISDDWLIKMNSADGVDSAEFYSDEQGNYVLIQIADDLSELSEINMWFYLYDSQTTETTDRVQMVLENATPYTYTELEDGTISLTGYTGTLSGDVTLPSQVDGKTVTWIANNAFENESNITSVVIPDGVTYVGAETFSGCTALQEVTIPDSVSIINSAAFWKCTSLKKFNLGDNSNYEFDNCLLIDTNNQQVTFCVTDVKGSLTIRDNVIRIYHAAFSGCTGLTEIVMPESLKRIYGLAFSDCASLKTVYLPAALEQIDQNAFNNCTSLSDVYFDGTAEEWAAITIGTGNEYLTNATIHYSESEASVFTDNGNSLSLEGKVSVNFYYAFNDVVLADEGAYVLLTMEDGSTVKTYIKDVAESNGEYMFNCTMAAAQMSDTITARVVMSDGTTSEIRSYSVQEYANNKQSSSNEALATLVKAMVNYGAAAQNYFSYNTESPANSILSEEDQALVAAVADDAVSGFDKVVSGTVEGLTANGSSLLLQGAVAIRHYFLLEDGYDINDYSFVVDGVELTPVYSDGEYYVDIVNIPSAYLDTMYTLTVNDSLSIEYSAMTYVQNKLANENSSDNLKTLCKALYLYNQAANTYFGK